MTNNIKDNKWSFPRSWGFADTLFYTCCFRHVTIMVTMWCQMNKWIITTRPYNLTITGHERKMTGYEWSLGKWLLRPESRGFTYRSVTSVARKNVYSPMTWQKPPRDCFNHYHVAVVIQWRTCLQIQSSCSLSCNETMKSLTRSRNWALAFWKMLAQLSLWRWIFSISDLCCTFQQNKFYFHLYFNSWLASTADKQEKY